MSELAADYALVGRHKAILPCLGCKGVGTVAGAPCAVCEGQKTRVVGCNGLVEVDRNHPTMCNCTRCGFFINPEEVTDAD